MTSLVVHAGTHATDWHVTQQQLASWRKPLGELSVRLSPGDAVEAWTAVARTLASGQPSRELDETAAAAVRDGASMLLLSSEQLEDPLRDEAAVRHLADFAAAHGMQCRVVVVLRDQVGYLNTLYRDRITHLQTARDFASFVAAPQPAERFDYATAFNPVMTAPDIEMVAVPYADLVDGAQARAILVAAGLSPADVDDLPAGPTRPGAAGPVLIAAMRLLFKRMWRLGMFRTLSRPRLLAAARILRDHAQQHSWDSSPFWGWSEGAREDAILRYRPGNDTLAAAAWGRPWDQPWESGPYVDMDLAAIRPALVVDVLVTVDAIMKDLQKAKGAVTAGVEAE